MFYKFKNIHKNKFYQQYREYCLVYMGVIIGFVIERFVIPVISFI